MLYKRSGWESYFYVMMEIPNVYTVTIAGVAIQLHTKSELLINDSFAPFLMGNDKADVQVFFRQVEELPEISKSIVYEDKFYKVHQSGNHYIYSFFDAPKDLSSYAVSRNNEKMSCVHIDYLEKGAHCVSELRNCFAHVNLESILLRHNRVFLHAACVNTYLGGILFSGKSGVGKSTQAELWRIYKNAIHINGDRPILSREESGWKAWGAPYAGSSQYHVDANCSVTSIIMLKQSEKCQLRKMNVQEAFRALWEGITLHSWDKTFVEKASELVLDLINQVPVYEYCCTPDEVAVDYLEKCLRKDYGLWQEITD